MKNARFWVYLHCPTKITLRPGQTLTHSTSAPTDEGWTIEGNVWEFDGKEVSAENFTDGVDCDGRYQTYNAARCPVDRLKAGPQHTEDGVAVAYPSWESQESHQRDFSAEAMGY